MRAIVIFFWVDGWEMRMWEANLRCIFSERMNMIVNDSLDIQARVHSNTGDVSLTSNSVSVKCEGELV